MAYRYQVLNSPNFDSPIIDVRHDGDHYTQDTGMSADYMTAIVYLEFFSDAKGQDQVTPTAGTVKVTGAPVGETYLEPSNGDGLIQAKDVAVAFGHYTPPMFTGLLHTVKVDVTGIRGANYMRVTVWRR